MPFYKASKGGVTSGFDYKNWLLSASIAPALYNSLDDVLADEKVLRKLFTIHASVDFLVANNTEKEIQVIINNDYCVKWINLRDYALDTLYADSIIKQYMDMADKYFYGEWCIIDDTTNPVTWGAKGNVPVMTSNTAPYGEVSTSSVWSGGYVGFNCFNEGSQNLGWWSSKGNNSNQYIQYKFTNPICVKKVYIKPMFKNNHCCVTSYKIQASNDGNEFINLYSGNFDDVNTEATVIFSNFNYYLYYRLFVDGTYNTVDDAISVSRLQFYGRELKISVPTMTSNTAPFGEVFGEYYTSSRALYMAFDNNKSTFWYNEAGIDYPYVGYDFKKDVRIRQITASLQKSGGTTQYFYFQYYDERTKQWIQCTEEKNFSTATNYVFNVDVYCRKIRFVAWRNDSLKVSTVTNELQFYGLDYSEYDWDKDNPRHYLYDHGVEPNGEVKVVSGTYGEIVKDSSDIFMSLLNASTTESRQTYANAYQYIDLSNYNLVRLIVGSRFNYDNTDNIGGLLGVWSEEPNTISYNEGNLVGYTSPSTVPLNNPYDVYFYDLSSINGNYYLAIGTYYYQNKSIEFTELWLE